MYVAKEVGVEPTRHTFVRLTGFEVRAPHRETMLFHFRS